MADSLNKLLGACAEGAVPPEVAPPVQALLEGRVKQCVIIFEDSNGDFLDCYPILDDNASRLAMLGAIETVKRDYMRSEIDSRVRYEYAQDDEDGDG